MNTDCIYVTYTQYDDLCTIANKPCDYLKDCEEPLWEYYMSLAMDYEEKDNG